jgi:hypothetical protein
MLTGYKIELIEEGIAPQEIEDGQKPQQQQQQSAKAALEALFS